MSAQFQKALTANSLAEGDVVFWAKGQWVEQFFDADLFGDEAAADAALATAKAQVRTVIDPYLIDVVEAESGLANKRLAAQPLPP
jgi:hypothetical protein